MILPHLNYENKALNKGLNIIVGIDEAGRGPLAGPVVAGAVWADVRQKESIISGWELAELRLIRDSKMLSPAQREKAFEIVAKNFHYGIGWCDHQTIDRMNILQAAYLAMKKALTDLKTKLDGEIDFILLDGNRPIPNLSYSQKAIVNGDKYVFSIAAASIVAKVTRDRMMLDMHEKYPQYGFNQHKGYGTRRHLEALEKYGPCPIHRLSFNRVNIKK